MRITKKVLSLILAFCMAFGVFSIAIAAEDSVPIAEAQASTGLRVTKADGTALGSSLAPGDVVRCYVGWQTNYNWRVISNIVYYDKTVFVPCYPDGDSFTEFTSKVNGSSAVSLTNGAFHPLTADDYAEMGKDVPTVGIINDLIGDYFSGQMNFVLTGGATIATVSGNFPPEMRTYNASTGKYNGVLKDEYANYDFVQTSVSISTSRGTGESFIIDEYQEYCYFYLKVRDDANLNTQAGLFMHPGSTKGVATYEGEGNYTGGKTSCSWMPSEAVATATNLSRKTCTVTTGETYYSISNGAPVATYTVDFDLNGGSGTTPASVTGEKGAKVTLPDATGFSRDGYTFKGWAESKTANEVLTSYSIPENGATLYAIWEQIPTYTVDFNLNGGVGTVPASVTGVKGTAVPLPATVNAVKNGFTFKGWSESSESSTLLTTYSITGNATLYAVWEAIPTYTVSFDLNGGTGTAPAAVTDVAGTPVDLPTTTATKEGFTFQGWATTTDATSALTSFTIPANNVTLYAVWSSNPTFTVSFDLNGATGTAPASVTGEVGTTVQLPTSVDATKEGCTFKGWGTSESSTYALESYTIPSGGKTLYAIWEAQTFTITYKAEGSNDIIKSYKFGANTNAAPAVPAKEGYEGSWDKETPATMPAENLTITAIYTAKLYTITYKVGNDVYATQDVAYGTTVTIKDVPDVEGKIGSWEWADATGKPVSAPTTMPAYALLATAKYEDIPVAYKVETYQMDTTGAYQLVATDNKTAAAKSDVSVTAPAASAGFTYETALSNVSGNVGLTDNSLILKLYYSRNQYTFNYVVNGENYDTQTYYYDAAFAFPAAPSVTAPARFLYWTLNDVQFTAPEKVGVYNSPVTLVAKIDDGTVKPADYSALYAFLESSSVNPRNMGLQSYFYLLPAAEGLSYADRAAEEIVHYKEPAKTEIMNALSFRTDCSEDEQNIVDGYLAEAKRVFDTYINHNKVDEEFECTVIDPFGNEGTEIAYRNPYTYEYYAENYFSELNIVQKEVTEDGTYVFDVVLSSNYPVATFGFPILINAEKFDIGTVPGTSSSYTTPNTEFFTKDGGFNAFYGYAQDGTSTVFQKHATATATNKNMYPGRYPEGPGWSAYDDLAFRNKYSIDFYVSGITQSTKSAPLAMSYDNLVIATFAIKLKDGAEFDKNDTFMVGDYFIGNQKTGDYGVSRTLYTVVKSKNSQISGPELYDAPMTNLSTTVTWLAEPETYTVSFDLNGGQGTAPDAITDVEGTVVTLPSTGATKTGCEFAGWAKTADATAAISNSYEITENITLYAVWAPKQYNYTVTNFFMGVDGSYPATGSAETKSAPYGTVINLTADTVDSFANFTFDSTAEGNVLTGTVDETETLNIVVYYARAQYDITYIVDGQTIDTVSVYYRASIPEKAVPEKTGYTGIWKWTKTEDETVLDEAPATMPAYALTATAEYADDFAEYIVNIYTMDTEGNYGEPTTSTKTGRVGTIADATPANIPEGFKIDETKENVITGTIVKDVAQLVLVVYIARETYTVTYKVAGLEDFVETYYVGAAVEAIEVPKDGNGNPGIWTWSTEDGNAPRYMPAANLIATAKYPVKVVPQVYVMDTEGNYGEAAEGTPVYGDVGQTVTADPGQIPTGFELDTTKTVLSGKILDETGATDETIAIYLARKQYTITYKAEGNDDIVKTYYFLAETEAAPAVPTLEGNTGSWDKETPAKMPAENLVINAVYAINQYTITYKAEGEEDIVKTYTYGAQTEAAPAVPEKEGYSGAWDTETPTTMPANNLVITAVYTPNTYTITYVVDGQDYLVKSYSFGQNIEKEDIPAVPAKEGFNGSWDKAVPATMGAENLIITAIYDENSYTVTYKIEGQDDIVETYVFGAAIAAAPQIPDRTGYSSAWVSEDGETYTQMPAKNLVFTAEYTIKSFTITYKVEGQDDIVRTYEYGADTDAAPEVPVIEGKTGRWNKETPATMPAENLVITAVYDNNEYTITYMVGNDAILVKTYEFGADTEAAPAVPEIEGFTGSWDAETPATMPAENLVIRAVYEKAEFTITYKIEGQDDIVRTYKFGDPTEAAPAIPEKNGYTGRWDNDTPETMPARNLIITALYESNKYTLTYKAEGFDDIVETYEFGAEIAAAPEVPSKEGCTGAWNTVAPETMPAENLVITAVYTPNDYTITYKIEGQDDIVRTYKFGADTEAAPAIPEKEGYTGAWDKETPATMPAQNLVITAVYATGTFTITYKIEGEDDIVKTYSFGANVEEAPAIPEKEGFTGAWDAEIPSTMPAENLVITAVYTANDYTITYKAEGEDDIVKTYKYNDPTDAAPAVPTKEGYNGAWDAETPTTMPAQNLVITALYTKAQFTITYIAGNDVVAVKTYEFEAATDPAPAVPEKDYFVGSWDTETPATMPAENLVIRAVYVDREYTITYVVDGENYLVKSYKYGDPTDAAPEVPAKEGFDGVWDASTPAKMPAEDLVITAKYTEKGEAKKVWAASYDKQLVIEADADALKVALNRTIDGTTYTWTYTRDNPQVSIVKDEETGRETWTITGLTLADGTYLARARYGDEWTDPASCSVAFTVYTVEERVPMTIVSVTPDEKYDGVDTKEIKVVTVGGPDKLQIRKIVDGNVYTWTYNRPNVTVNALDDKGTEEWVLNVGLAEGDYTMCAKAYNTWEYIDSVDFTIDYWVVSEEFGVKSAAADENEEDTYNIVVVGGADKIQLESEKGTYTFSKNNATVVVDEEDPSIATWTINAVLADGSYQINIKRNGEWTAAAGTLTVKNA